MVSSTWRRSPGTIWRRSLFVIDPSSRSEREVAETDFNAETAGSAEFSFSRKSSAFFARSAFKNVSAISPLNRLRVLGFLRSPHYFASGFGRIWNLSTFCFAPLPPSTCQAAYVEKLDQSPFPFHPPFGSSIRPTAEREKKPMGYGTRSVTN